MWNDYYHLSTDPTIKGTSRAPLPGDSHAYAIIESRGADEATDAEKFIRTLEQALEQGLITDAVIAKSEAERSDIWQIRENVDLTLRHQPAFNFDISLPINSMQTYLDQVTTTLRASWPDVIVYAYGHLADSNLHVTVVPAPENFIKNPDEPISRVQTSNETEAQWYKQSNESLFKPLKEIGGSISAEHGIGLLKKQYLPYSRTEEEITTMQLLKRSLDAKNILNPGKIV